MHLAKPQDNKTIEFDIALTVDDSTATGGQIGVGIAQLFTGSGETTKERSKSEISRIKFGVYISTETKEQIEKQRQEIKARNNNR
jgi:hypothetical protein